jgi:hypothetical protein
MFLRQSSSLAVFTLLAISFSKPAVSQPDDDLKIFGYFQNTYRQLHNTTENETETSFNLQQLNIFFQKDLAENWRSFINFEALNSFSSSHMWGAFNLSEAWIRYQRNDQLNLKLGLLLPTFNRLNEIKNRTPLLPYIARPIAYETSFSEFIATEDYTPERAFAQLYGLLPLDEIRLEYAIYVGNSPNINNDSQKGQTGVDTTTSFLVGGRLGVRLPVVSLGFSLSRDRDNRFQQVSDFFEILEKQPAYETPRTRLGADFSSDFDPYYLEAEIIWHKLAEKGKLDLERNFYYVTLGYIPRDNWHFYVNYAKTKDVFEINNEKVESLSFGLPSVGVAWHLNDRMVFKFQYTYVTIEAEAPTVGIEDHLKLHHVAVAASVIF